MLRFAQHDRRVRSSPVGCVARVSALAALALFVAQDAFAQGCALCYTTAAAAGQAAARSLDIGILVLLVPSLVLFICVLAFAIRRAAN